MAIHAGRGMIIPPIEPKILQKWQSFQTFSLLRAGSSTALKIPFTAGSGIDQNPFVAAALAEEFDVGTIEPAYKSTHRFPVRPRGQKNRKSAQTILNGRLSDKRSDGIRAASSRHFQ